MIQCFWGNYYKCTSRQLQVKQKYVRAMKALEKKVDTFEVKSNNSIDEEMSLMS